MLSKVSAQNLNWHVAHNQPKVKDEPKIRILFKYRKNQINYNPLFIIFSLIKSLTCCAIPSRYTVQQNGFIRWFDQIFQD